MAVLECSRSAPPVALPAVSIRQDATAPVREAGRDAPSEEGAVDAAADVVDRPAAPAIDALEAGSVLFLGSSSAEIDACATGTDPERVRCLIDRRYVRDERGRALARSIYDGSGDVAGLSPAETMDGGFRGTLHLVPELPVGNRRKHLEWIASAAADYDEFFQKLGERAGRPVPYRWRALTFRFMRSVGRTTPSAYASGWSVAYNVDGSLNLSADAVRELVFHEIFHLNDQAHGDWSAAHLRPIFDAVAARCRSSTTCLAPYAPTETRVRGGTYYAFQPNNGESVHEYAAELALRYYREQRAVLRGAAKLQSRFECGPPENRRAWDLLAAEFFGGVDVTGPCVQ